MKNMLVNSEKAMLRAATVLAGFGSSPAMTVMEPQHQDSAHCKTQAVSSGFPDDNVWLYLV